MKIIELLNKIANGEEVPNRVRFNNVIWNKVHGEKNILYEDEYDNDLFIHFFRRNLDFTLNDEVEIIEEDKKIEKLENEIEFYSYSKYEKLKNDVDKILYILRAINLTETKISNLNNKLNEIIDKVNSLENKQ